MSRTITASELLDELKRSDEALVVINDQMEDREDAIDYLERDLAQGRVAPDKTVVADTVTLPRYTFEFTLPRGV